MIQYIKHHCRTANARTKKQLSWISITLLLLTNISSTSAQSFNAPINPRGTSVGNYSTLDARMTLINGKPAVAFMSTDYPKFIMSRDSNGTSWTNIYVADNTVDLNSDHIALVNANSRPGIFYVDYGNPSSRIYFRRANNDTGSSWGSRQLLHNGPRTINSLTSQVVNGNPAAFFLCHKSPAKDTAYFLRASNADGTSWNSPVVISRMTTNIREMSSGIINGKPAVCFFESNNDSLFFAIANDSSGTSWNTPISLGDGTSANTAYSSVAEVNGRPAIAFKKSPYDTLFYIRANDANGSSWPSSPIAIYNPGTSEGNTVSLATIADTPVIFFDWTGDSDNNWIKANDTTGSSWGSPVGFNCGNAAQSIAMVVDSRDDVHLVYLEGLGDSLGYIYGDSPDAVTSTEWNGSTWSNGVPDSTTDVIISSNTAPATFSCKSITIGSGFALNTGTNAVVTIYGDLVNNGDGVSGTGTIVFSADGAASITGDTVDIAGTIIVESGCTLSTNSLLRLTSDATNTGRIGESDGTISGNVYIQRYMPGKRCFRFYGHPYSSSIALNQLTTDIDITGPGGSSNGFTTTGTNNPSAFWFDVTTADTSTSGANPGWTAFTSANTNDWDRYELLRLLVRGDKGEGLNGGSYTPTATTIEGTGTINQGTQVVTLTKGSNTEFVGCGNPFPSPVQMNTVARGSNVGANYYAWDATSGASGAYVTNAWTLDYKLPAFSAFFTTVSANSNNTLTFEEQDKEANGAGLFKPTGPDDWVELYIYDSTTKWDRLLIHLDDNAMDVEDKMDGKKLYNPNLDFFTLSKDDVRLAVDVRPYNDGASIPLGLTAYNRYNKYVIKTGMYNIPAGAKLYLHDKYLNTKQELKAGFEYWFDVTADTASQGNNRFEINMVGKTAGIITANNNIADMQLIPNPAHNEVKIAFKALEGLAQLTLTSATGQVLIRKEVAGGTGSVRISLQNIPAGMYIAELKGDNATFTQKLIKQ